MEQIIRHFDKVIPLTEEEKDALAKRLVPRTLRRRQYLLQEGDVCRHFSYVVEGCFKMYGVDASGAEYNLSFTVEDDWVADLDSLHKMRPSKWFIEAVESCSILQLSKRDLWYLYTRYPKFDRHFRVIIEDKYTELQNRLLQAYSTTARQRYQTFMEQYPGLANRLPNTQIASYLGITPEFLSKIRHAKARL